HSQQVGFCHIRKKSIAEYMSFTQANLDKYTVNQMCKVLKFPRSTYYAAINHVTSQREIEYNKFSEEVQFYYDHSKANPRDIMVLLKYNETLKKLVSLVHSKECKDIWLSLVFAVL